MPGHESQRPVGLRCHHTTNKRQQPFRERVGYTNLQYRALGE